MRIVTLVACALLGACATPESKREDSADAAARAVADTVPRADTVSRADTTPDSTLVAPLPPTKLPTTVRRDTTDTTGRIIGRDRAIEIDPRSKRRQFPPATSTTRP